MSLKKLRIVWICFLSSLVFLTSFSFNGCAAVGGHIVYAPTACKVLKRKRPTQTGNNVVDIVNILKYTEGLEYDLNYCTKGYSGFMNYNENWQNEK